MVRIAWNKRNSEDVKSMVEKLGYFLIETYVYNKTRVIIRDSYGYMYDCDLYNLLNGGNTPRIVFLGNQFSIMNISIWIRINNRNFEICENNYYEGEKKDISFHCFKCDDIFYSSWSEIKQGKGCGVCNGKQTGERHSLFYLRPDLAKEWSKNNEISSKDITIASEKVVLWICGICKKEYPSKIEHRTLSNSGCPNCSSSKGEKKVSKFLDFNNIFYKPQKLFDDCVDKRKLRFDFGIPYDDGSWKCIEYYGEQHFFPVDFAGNGDEWAKKNFEENQKKDEIKQKYCEDNNISLLIIPYWEFDNIEKILEDFLFE